MREQIVEVSVILGILVIFWAAFAVLTWRLWRRLAQSYHQKSQTFYWKKWIFRS